MAKVSGPAGSQLLSCPKADALDDPKQIVLFRVLRMKAAIQPVARYSDAALMTLARPTKS